MSESDEEGKKCGTHKVLILSRFADMPACKRRTICKSLTVI